MKNILFLKLLIASLLALWTTGCMESGVSEAKEKLPETDQISHLRAPELLPIHVRFPGRDPSLAISEDGHVHVVYLDSESSRLVHRRLDREGGSHVTLITPAELEIGTRAEVRPAFEALAGNRLIVAYPVRLPGKWKGEIRFQTSDDGGLSWSEPVLLHDDLDNYGSHSFLASARVGTDAAVFTWLDSRDGNQGLRSARWRAGSGVSKNLTIDAQTCQCCVTEVVADQEGYVWTAYRDLDPESQVRDMSWARSEDAGLSFTPQSRISEDGWEIQGCPHSGPQLTQARNGDLWAIWFTGKDPGIYVASSELGIQSFRPRQLIAAPSATGRVSEPEIESLSRGELVALYVEQTSAGQQILARVADPEGRNWSAPILVASQGQGPRVESGAGRNLLSWALEEDGQKITIVQDLGPLLLSERDLADQGFDSVLFKP